MLSKHTSKRGKITPSAKKVTLSYLNKIRPGITVVRVPFQIAEAVLFCVVFKDSLLVANGIALALQLVLMG